MHTGIPGFDELFTHGIPQGSSVLVAGGSGSGKTTVANRILQRVGKGRITFLPHDAYYKDLGHLSLEERAKVNFDHPDSLETELLVEHIQKLKCWQAIEMPVYELCADG